MDKIQQSIDFLRKLETDEPFYLGFSGGKDSVDYFGSGRTCWSSFHRYLCQHDGGSTGYNLFHQK